MEGIILLCGYSGVGKSSFAKFLQDQKGYLWVELDPYPKVQESEGSIYPFKGSIDKGYIERLRAYCRKNRLKGAVISLRSTDIIDEVAVQRLDTLGVTTVYLVASASFCLRRFEEREKNSGRELPASHWLQNNLRLSIFIESSRSSKINLIDVVSEHGIERSNESIFEQILKKS